MPRTARASVGGLCYHVLNRGNARARVFHGRRDYVAFLDLLQRVNTFVPMRILGFCLMPNHFHLALWPHRDGDLGRWMQWLMTTQVRWHHLRHHTSGHVWQGRFKAFPIQDDDHLVTVLRYIDQNPLRAGLVDKAQDWPWSTLACLPPNAPRKALITAGPFPRGTDWIEEVNTPLDRGPLACVRTSVARGSPYGSDAWVKRTARTLGLEASLNSAGRPKHATPSR